MLRAAGHVLLVLALALVGLTLPGGPAPIPGAPTGMGAPADEAGLPPDAQIGGLPPALAGALRHGVTHPAAWLPSAPVRAAAAPLPPADPATHRAPPARDPEQPGAGAAVR